MTIRLATSTEAEALTIASRVMQSRQAPGNPHGDGRPYATLYAGSLTVDDRDGSAELRLRDEDEQHLTTEERERIVRDGDGR